MAQQAAVEKAPEPEDAESRNFAAIEDLQKRIENLRSSGIPPIFDQSPSDRGVAEATRIAGYEIALAIREVGAMVADALETEPKRQKTGKASFV